MVNEQDLKVFLQQIGDAKGERIVGASFNGTDVSIFCDNHVIMVSLGVSCRCIDCIQKHGEKIVRG